MLSYSLDCIPCEHTYYKVGRFIYIVMRVLLITILYIVILLLDIRYSSVGYSFYGESVECLCVVLSDNC